MVPRKNNTFYGPVALKCASIPTGTWRIKRPVITGKCVNCKNCTLYCPSMCIEVTNENKIFVDYQYCKGCGICANICKINAIEMIDEKGE